MRAGPQRAVLERPPVPPRQELRQWAWARGEWGGGSPGQGPPGSCGRLHPARSAPGRAPTLRPPSRAEPGARPVLTQQTQQAERGPAPRHPAPRARAPAAQHRSAATPERCAERETLPGPAGTRGSPPSARAWGGRNALLLLLFGPGTASPLLGCH